MDTPQIGEELLKACVEEPDASAAVITVVSSLRVCAPFLSVTVGTVSTGLMHAMSCYGFFVKTAARAGATEIRAAHDCPVVAIALAKPTGVSATTVSGPRQYCQFPKPLTDQVTQLAHFGFSLFAALTSPARRFFIADRQHRAAL